VTLWQTVIYFVYKLSLNCRSFSSNRRLPTGFIFQQDSAPAHTARSAGNWLRANCPDFIRKDQWPPNSPNANSVDYHVWCAMLELTASLIQSPKQSRNSMNRFRLSGATYHITRTDRQDCKRLLKLSDWRLVSDIGAVGEHFEHSQWQWNFDIWSLVNCVVWLVSTMLLNWCCSLNIFSRWKIGKRSC